MDRYIGLYAHSSSCTVAVIGPSGKRLQTQVLETNAKVLIDFIRAIPGTRHLCLGEGTHSNWLYEVLSPHAEEIVVAGQGYALALDLIFQNAGKTLRCCLAVILKRSQTKSPSPIT